MENELPMNRKERFFTGTIFPMIVCREQFKYFNHFISLLDDLSNVEINAAPENSNIQFFTEYSLVESIIGESELRFPDPPVTKDTPDIITLIKTSDRGRVLIAIEAKMYNNPTVHKLKTQMDNQRDNILEYLRENLEISEIHHYALLPGALFDKIREAGFNYPVILWEDIYDIYRKLFGDDYFLEILRIAISSYEELVSRSAQYGMNCEEQLKGEYIYQNYKRGTLDKIVMGRNYGFYGNLLSEDISSGTWREQVYETSSAENPPNRNWFYIKEFVERIDQNLNAKQIAGDE
ncbi:MAG: hypothetical protein R6U43_02950 [Candidatus Krumholzibacteriales bacterium]